VAVTRRGKLIVTVVGALAITGVGVGALALTGHAPAPIQRVFDEAAGRADPAPPECPLNGTDAPGGAIPDRPALAVKVENLAEARPQAGLARADIVYEEPVEGGITRFIALFQCHDAKVVGPIRSGRTTDPQILVQYGRPPIAYSGGANAVRKAIGRAGLTDISETESPGAYTRDPDRLAPHDLFSTTADLWAAAKARDGAPEAVFTYADQLEMKSRKVRTIHLPFSTYSDVNWTWSKRQGAWLRAHGAEPHLLVDGAQVVTTNIVVQVVDVVPGEIIDPAGNPSPEVDVLGKGRAYVLRDGRMVVGRWERAREGDVTTFTTKSGETIPLAPGVTWVELFPSTIAVETT
jgi:Protein of unknown function (DUF3048) N-terminal domain/Protein of unknown function (DUF3048) C-terminal domain